MGYGSYEESDDVQPENNDDEVDEEEVLEINQARTEGKMETDFGDKEVGELLDAI